MPNKSYQKGYRLEKKVLDLAREHNLDVEREFMSGAYQSDAKDLIFGFMGQQLNGECKSRRDGFKQIYKWLEGNDFLFVKKDRGEIVVCVRAKKLFAIMEAAQ